MLALDYLDLFNRSGGLGEVDVGQLPRGIAPPLQVQELGKNHRVEAEANQARGVAANDRVGRHSLGNDGVGGDDGTIADYYARHDHRSVAYINVITDTDWLEHGGHRAWTLRSTVGGVMLVPLEGIADVEQWLGQIEERAGTNPACRMTCTANLHILANRGVAADGNAGIVSAHGVGKGTKPKRVFDSHPLDRARWLENDVA